MFRAESQQYQQSKYPAHHASPVKVTNIHDTTLPHTQPDVGAAALAAQHGRRSHVTQDLASANAEERRRLAGQSVASDARRFAYEQAARDQYNSSIGGGGGGGLVSQAMAFGGSGSTNKDWQLADTRVAAAAAASAEPAGTSSKQHAAPPSLPSQHPSAQSGGAGAGAGATDVANVRALSQQSQPQLGLDGRPLRPGRGPPGSRAEEMQRQTELLRRQGEALRLQTEAEQMQQRGPPQQQPRQQGAGEGVESPESLLEDAKLLMQEQMHEAALPLVHQASLLVNSFSNPSC